MTLTIYRFEDTATLIGGIKVPVCRVEDLETAEKWFLEWADQDDFDPELHFEADPDFDHCADVAMIYSNRIDLYSVEGN